MRPDSDCAPTRSVIGARVTRPSTEADLAALVRDAPGPLLVQGNGTKAAMLRPAPAAATLSTAALTGVTLYSPQELVLSAQAGTPLAEIEALLAAHGQQLIAEPSHLFGERQTLGGIVGVNLSGPRRVSGGAMRDHVLGVRAVNGRGEALRFGGRVLKNVTGLDIPKLLTGSFGTLAVLTEITLKVLPAPEASATVIISGLDATAAVRAMSAGLGSPFSVSGAAYLPARRAAILRLEAFAASLRYRTEKLAAQLAPHGPTDILPEAESQTLWRDIRDCRMLAGEALWRVSTPPSAGPAILAAAEAAGLAGFLDWGGGLAWLAGPATTTAHQSICTATEQAGGVWWLMRAPAPLRAAVRVIPDEPPALAALSRRVKESFDPRGIFSPGRMRA